MSVFLTGGRDAVRQGSDISVIDVRTAVSMAFAWPHGRGCMLLEKAAIETANGV